MVSAKVSNMEHRYSSRLARVLKDLQEKLVGLVQTYFSGAARQSVFLLLAIGFALVARFDSEPLHKSTKIRFENVQGGSQNVDLTSFCPMLQYVNEGISLRFKISVPRNLNEYLIFSTSQGDGGIRFIVNRDRQLVALHGSSKLVLSEPIIIDPLASSISGENIDIDITLGLILDPLLGGRQRILFMIGYPDLQRTNAFMSVVEFNQIICEDQGLIGEADKNSYVSVTVRDYISPASQEASRSTILLRALVSLSLSLWFGIKWIHREQTTMRNHGQH